MRNQHWSCCPFIPTLVMVVQLVTGSTGQEQSFPLGAGSRPEHWAGWLQEERELEGCFWKAASLPRLRSPKNDLPRNAGLIYSWGLGSNWQE